jgi:hypothetical protein
VASTSCTLEGPSDDAHRHCVERVPTMQVGVGASYTDIDLDHEAEPLNNVADGFGDEAEVVSDAGLDKVSTCAGRHLGAQSQELPSVNAEGAVCERGVLVLNNHTGQPAVAVSAHSLVLKRDACASVSHPLLPEVPVQADADAGLSKHDKCAPTLPPQLPHLTIHTNSGATEGCTADAGSSKHDKCALTLPLRLPHLASHTRSGATEGCTAASSSSYPTSGHHAQQDGTYPETAAVDQRKLAAPVPQVLPAASKGQAAAFDALAAPSDHHIAPRHDCCGTPVVPSLVLTEATEYGCEILGKAVTQAAGTSMGAVTQIAELGEDVDGDGKDRRKHAAALALVDATAGSPCEQMQCTLATAAAHVAATPAHPMDALMPAHASACMTAAPATVAEEIAADAADGTKIMADIPAGAVIVSETAANQARMFPPTTSHDAVSRDQAAGRSANPSKPAPDLSTAVDAGMPAMAGQPAIDSAAAADLSPDALPQAAFKAAATLSSAAIPLAPVPAPFASTPDDAPLRVAVQATTGLAESASQAACSTANAGVIAGPDHADVKPVNY